MIMKITKKSSTHFPILMKVLEISDGPVMEIGSSISSTPLLHWLCREKNLKLVTYEKNPDNFAFAKGFQSRNHSIRFVKDWEEIDTESHWGVVLLDQIPEIRMVTDPLRLKDNTDYIVTHDILTEDYDQVWPHFKHHYEWKESHPRTVVFSNLKNLSNLQRINIYSKTKWTEISKIFFVIGSIGSVIALVFSPTPYNYVIPIVYIITCILNYVIYSKNVIIDLKAKLNNFNSSLDRAKALIKDKPALVKEKTYKIYNKVIDKSGELIKKYSLVKNTIRSWFL